MPISKTRLKTANDDNFLKQTATLRFQLLISKSTFLKFFFVCSILSCIHTRSKLFAGANFNTIASLYLFIGLFSTKREFLEHIPKLCKVHFIDSVWISQFTLFQKKPFCFCPNLFQGDSDCFETIRAFGRFVKSIHN